MQRRLTVVIDLHRLRLLRELSARGTVHAAASALGYSPSAVSQQLAVLEREVGMPVLERHGRTLRLTDAGRVLVRHAELLLAGVDDAEAELASLTSGKPAGTVRVTAFQSAMTSLVPQAVRRLRTLAPGVRVEAAEAEIQQSAKGLGTQAVDVALGDEFSGIPAPVVARARRHDLLSERMNVVLPSRHPQADAPGELLLERLADAPWAACSPGTGQYAMHLRLCRELGGFEPDTRYAADNVATLIELVRSTGACTLLSDLALHRPHAGVSHRAIDRPGTGRTVFALTRRATTPAVDAVVEALTFVAGEWQRATSDAR